MAKTALPAPAKGLDTTEWVSPILIMHRYHIAHKTLFAAIKKSEIRIKKDSKRYLVDLKDFKRWNEPRRKYDLLAKHR